MCTVFRVSANAAATILLSATILCPSLLAQIADVDQLNATGHAAYLAGDYAGAERAFRLAVVAADEGGVPTAQRAMSASNLAQILASEGKFAASAEYFQRALNIIGVEAADLRIRAVLLPNLAGLYTQLHRYREAEALLEEGLMLSKRFFGNGSPEVAGVLSRQGRVYWETSRAAEAERTLKKAIAITEKNLGREHAELPPMLSSLAAVFAGKKDWKKAEPLMMRALLIQEHLLSSSHPDLARTLHNLGGLYLSQNRGEAAEGVLRRALQVRQQALGLENMDVAFSSAMLGAALVSQHRDGEARSLLETSISTQERVLGRLANESREFLWTLDQYAKLLRRSEDPEMAQLIEARAQSLREEAIYTVSTSRLKN